MKIAISVQKGRLLLAPFDKGNSTRGFWRDKAAGQWQFQLPFVCLILWQRYGDWIQPGHTGTQLNFFS